MLGRPRSPRNQPIGYVPQKVLLDPDMPMRAKDLVALGIDGHRYGLRLPSKDRGEAVRAMLHAVDADRFADARVGNLSGGEQQRVLIAHALISRPRLLLLDEPLANLDLRSGQEVIALLARIAREQQIAVLLSAHEMNPLLPVMDRIVYLAGGRAASGPTDQVVTPEVLTRLYGHHVDVLHVHGRVLVVAGAAADETQPPRTGRRRTGYRGGLTSMHQLYTAVFEPGFFASAQVHVAATIGAIVAVVSAVVGRLHRHARPVLRRARARRRLRGRRVRGAADRAHPARRFRGRGHRRGRRDGHDRRPAAAGTGPGHRHRARRRHRRLRPVPLPRHHHRGHHRRHPADPVRLHLHHHTRHRHRRRDPRRRWRWPASRPSPARCCWPPSAPTSPSPAACRSAWSAWGSCWPWPSRSPCPSLAIGAILSTALLIGPAAAALRLTKTLPGALAAACLTGVAATWLGILLAYDSYYWGPGHQSLPVSFFIVAIVFATYLAAGLPAARAAERQRTATPVTGTADRGKIAA